MCTCMAGIICKPFIKSSFNKFSIKEFLEKSHLSTKAEKYTAASTQETVHKATSEYSLRDLHIENLKLVQKYVGFFPLFFFFFVC